MLKNQIKNLISSMEKPELFKEEKEYAEKHLLLPDHVSILDKNPESRFVDAYIERSDKESEEVIQVEDESFLKQPVGYLKKQMNEFIYVESNWFELIGVDAVSLEVDDVFGTYDVMLGLKLQKKWESVIKAELNESLQDEAKFDLMFSSDDGLWNLNFDLDSVVGFKEEMTIGEAFHLIYQFLFKLVAAVEEHK
jgi:hypothetical protein